jgi:hypothetical protein
MGLRVVRYVFEEEQTENDMGWEPPEESKSVELHFGGKVHYGRATRSGQTVGIEPMALRIELPPGHGDCPDDWFYVGHTSEHSLLRSLADGFVPDVLRIECYRQAWLQEKRRNKK